MLRGFAVSETLQKAYSWLDGCFSKHAVSMLQAFCTEAESAKPRSNNSKTPGKSINFSTLSTYFSSVFTILCKTRGMVENYSEDSIRTLDWREHIRRRPGMYIGKLGDGSAPDDGIYILVKEVVDNSIDEFAMGAGNEIRITVEDRKVTVRDFGRGIPLGKLVDVSSRMNTGAKYDSEAFKKSVGLNGVGIKAVNALSETFIIQAFREGETKYVQYGRGEITEERDIVPTDEPNGTMVTFWADREIFGNYHFIADYLEAMFKNYVFLNTGLSITFNGHKLYSKRGLYDLLMENMSGEGLYPVIHLKGGRHRDGHDPRTPVWGGILFVRKRPAYHPGRNSPGGIPGGYCQDPAGFL